MVHHAPPRRAGEALNPAGAGDTIAAVATAAGAAGIGVLRVSGPAVPDIALAITGRRLSPRAATHARFLDADGTVIDDGLALYFPAPRSFTGEHVLELQGHGAPVLLRALLARVCQLGARPARPGEFSERAFLNGKLDLLQAEAVADLVAAQSIAAARAARRSLDGDFSRRVEALFEALTALRVHVEAAIDFPEEEIDFLATPELAAQYATVAQAHRQLLAEAERGQRLRDGLHVVIVGAPNTGKSSLLNALAGRERAIVTDIAGTTRDLLAEAIELDGVSLTLVDTAGLRESSDRIEAEGMRRARDELARADLALALLAPEHEHAEDALREAVSAVPRVLWLHNKIDLCGEPAREQARADGDHLWLSVATGDGVGRLRERLRQAAAGEAGEGAFSARARHVEALRRVGAHLEAARVQLLEAQAGELAAEELRLAQHELGELTGAFSSDALLGRIFSSFCIGK